MENVKINKMPLIKWTGSKRKQATYIVKQIPQEFDTYYEPFLGGGSVMHEVLNQIAIGNIKCRRLVCSDLNVDLINIWNLFKNNRTYLYDKYCEMYQLLKERSQIKDGETFTSVHVRNAETYYYEMRDKYNKMVDDNITNDERAIIFYWLTRTCFNGLIRFSPKNMHFTTSFHVGGRLGITPDELLKVFDAWGSVIDNVDIQFINKSYDDVICNATENDVVYLDPPYANMHGVYFNEYFGIDKFLRTLYKLNYKHVKWLLSYDGITGDDDWTEAIPNDLYIRHIYVNSGQSNFKKLKSNTNKEFKNKDIVKDSLYINF